MEYVWRCTYTNESGEAKVSWHTIKHGAKVALERAKRKQGIASEDIAKVRMPETRAEFVKFLNSNNITSP